MCTAYARALTGILLLAMVAAAATTPATADTVTRLADRLVAQQAANGSWTGETDFTGSIVAGLVNAYGVTGDLSYKMAAEQGGTWILNNSSPNFYGDEAYALTALSSLAANPANNAWRTAVSDFYIAVKADVPRSTNGYIQGFSSIDPSTATFYLAGHAAAAFYVNATDKTLWRNGLIGYLADVTDSAYYPVMALGVAVWGLAQTGPMDSTLVDPAAAPGSIWYGKELADLPGMLAEQQVADGENAGSFYYRFDRAAPGGADPSGYTEDTLFGTLGLVAANSANPALGYEDEILAARTVLAAGVATDGRAYEHLWLGGASYRLYAGETLQALPGPSELNEWVLTGGGSYNVPSDWRANTVPDAAGAVANFLGNITAPGTVTVDSAVTVGAITFASEHGYTVAGPDSIALEDPDGEARIALQRGSHEISAPLVLGSALDVTAAAGTGLTISGPLDNSAGEALTKNGEGTVTISGPQTHGAGAALRVAAGTLNLLSDAGSEAEANLTLEVDGGDANLANTQHLDALNIAGISMVVLTPGPAVLVVKSLAPANTATLDLAAGNLIVDYEPGSTPFDQVQVWVHTGLGTGTWDGTGITSSVANASAKGIIGVGVVENNDADLLEGTGRTRLYDNLEAGDGVALDETCVLVKVTYWGDANLDGVIDANDYDQIDRNYLFPPAVATWSLGDFNYDGVIDANDYDKIDRAYLFQGGPMAAGGAVPAATPEPATLALLALGGLGLLGLRRRPR